MTTVSMYAILLYLTRSSIAPSVLKSLPFSGQLNILTALETVTYIFQRVPLNQAVPVDTLLTEVLTAQPVRLN